MTDAIDSVTDTSLLKIVHDETHGNLKVGAMITRFGELYAWVCHANTFENLYTCNNILDARRWARNHKGDV